ncbi:MAG TPA: Zn-dependent hydrolase [Acidobacteriota bacterium]|nr:Zn-dependent hydrolase [Acidobacteriota bacterium]
MTQRIISALLIVLLGACGVPSGDPADDSGSEIEAKLNKYTTVRLTTDLSVLGDEQKKIIPYLIEAAKAMDGAFWQQAYGDKSELMRSISDPRVRRYAEINYGPWDRLEENEPFVEGIGPKPAGANFYPRDMSKDEYQQALADNPALGSLYTMVRRDQDGDLQAIPYSEFFQDSYAVASHWLGRAALMATNEGLKKYLDSRIQALQTDEYRPSDMAWMDMKDNTLDIVIGPIETYEDQLNGAKAANEAYVLVKDQEWSRRLARYTSMLPDLQGQLPVDKAYKSETPGLESDLNAYDVVYYAGDCNAGSKTIAINLPNDEAVQLAKGTRRLQLKNAMRAKFDKILLPLSDEMIAPDQRQFIDFDAFFSNVMFHEVAHGLGIKNTISGEGTVRQALKEKASTLEEGKADILGLFMVTKLIDGGQLDSDVRTNYVTFLASIFRSIRFGLASAHGRANQAEFNFLQEAGAFRYDSENHTYSVDFERMREGVEKMAARILTLQGDGDYDGVNQFLEDYGKAGADLESDLQRLAEKGIPVDIVFEQGVEVLGLQPVAAEEE